ncbi:hypothetical protein, partial [Aeromonas caviae]|uniref:hypothetical protein n=1 Tax=Aeromonas caviae TaxID=648 RepID=UPI003014C756
LFGDKIRSQTKPFLYLFQLVAAKDPVHDALLTDFSQNCFSFDSLPGSTPSPCLILRFNISH